MKNSHKILSGITIICLVAFLGQPGFSQTFSGSAVYSSLRASASFTANRTATINKTVRDIGEKDIDVALDDDNNMIAGGTSFQEEFELGTYTAVATIPVEWNEADEVFTLAQEGISFAAVPGVTLGEMSFTAITEIDHSLTAADLYGINEKNSWLICSEDVTTILPEDVIKGGLYGEIWGTANFDPDSGEFSLPDEQLIYLNGIKAEINGEPADLQGIATLKANGEITPDLGNLLCSTSYAFHGQKAIILAAVSVDEKNHKLTIGEEAQLALSAEINGEEMELYADAVINPDQSVTVDENSLAAARDITYRGLEAQTSAKAVFNEETISFDLDPKERTTLIINPAIVDGEETLINGIVNENGEVDEDSLYAIEDYYLKGYEGSKFSYVEFNEETKSFEKTAGVSSGAVIYDVPLNGESELQTVYIDFNKDGNIEDAYYFEEIVLFGDVAETPVSINIEDIEEKKQ